MIPKTCPETQTVCYCPPGYCANGSAWRPLSPSPIGWRCPACGAGVAPGVERCPCVPLTVTCGTAAGEDWPERAGAAIRRAIEQEKNAAARAAVDAVALRKSGC